MYIIYNIYIYVYIIYNIINVYIYIYIIRISPP